MKAGLIAIILLLSSDILGHQDSYYKYKYDNVNVIIKTGSFCEEVNNAKIIGQYASILCREYHFENNYKKLILETAIGVNLVNSCLNLRSSPSIKGEIVTCLKNNLINDSDGGPTQLVILEFIGNWAYILAKDYKYDVISDDVGEGCSYKVAKENKGYVKVIDDNGRPNIWYAVR